MIYVIVGIVFAIILLTLIVIYIFKIDNKLVNYKNSFKDTLNEIDTEMNVRIENIKKYIDIVGEHVVYNKEASENLKNLQKSIESYYSSATRKMQIINNDNLTRNFNILHAYLVNNKNDIINDESFQKLADLIKTSENKITFSKKNFNAQAKNYNELVTKFPSIFIAKIFKYKPVDLFGATYD